MVSQPADFTTAVFPHSHWVRKERWPQANLRLEDVVEGCTQLQEGAPGSRPLFAWRFPACRLTHNEPIRSHSDGMEGGFFVYIICVKT